MSGSQSAPSAISRSIAPRQAKANTLAKVAAQKKQTKLKEQDETEVQDAMNQKRTPKVRTVVSSRMLPDVGLRVRDKAPNGERCVVTLEEDHIGLQNCHIVDLKLATQEDIVSDIPHQLTCLLTRLYSWIVWSIHGVITIANSTLIAVATSC
jgi:predicted site-specific integrase-resolvase